GGDAEVPEIGFTPEKGIAKAGQARVVRRLQDRLLPFLPGAKFAVAGSRQTLGFAEIVYAIAQRGLLRGGGFHSRVKNGGGAAIIDGASGEATVRISAIG